MATDTYSYAEEFQCKIVALCLRDPRFIVDYDDVVDPRYFDFDYLTSIVKIAKEFISRHNELPSKASLIEDTRDYCLAYKIDPADTQDIIEHISDLYRQDLYDQESIKERVIRFGRRQALKSAVVEIANIIDRDSEYDRAFELVGRALSVGQNVNNLGSTLFGKFTRLPNEANASGIHDARTKIPTRLRSFDGATFGGKGPGRGQVWVVLGLPGIGKSQWLIHCGAVALQESLPVVHITCGDLDEMDVSLRYAARLTQLPIEDVLNNTELYQRRAAKLDQIQQRYLRVKFYPSGTFSLAMLRSYLSRLKVLDGISPALLIIDYADQMKAEADNGYESMGRIYTGINGIAHEYNCLVWTASQVQRWSPRGDEEYITQENVADSFRKAAEADGICSFNQTVSEYQRCRARIFLDKVRRGKRRRLIHVHAEFDRSYIRELSEEELEREEQLRKEEVQKAAEDRKRKRLEDRQAKARDA